MLGRCNATHSWRRYPIPVSRRGLYKRCKHVCDVYYGGSCWHQVELVPCCREWCLCVFCLCLYGRDRLSCWNLVGHQFVQVHFMHCWNLVEFSCGNFECHLPIVWRWNLFSYCRGIYCWHLYTVWRWNLFSYCRGVYCWHLYTVWRWKVFNYRGGIVGRHLPIVPQGNLAQCYWRKLRGILHELSHRHLFGCFGSNH